MEAFKVRLKNQLLSRKYVSHSTAANIHIPFLVNVHPMCIRAKVEGYILYTYVRFAVQRKRKYCSRKPSCKENTAAPYKLPSLASHYAEPVCCKLQSSESVGSLIVVSCDVYENISCFLFLSDWWPDSFCNPVVII